MNCYRWNMSYKSVQDETRYEGISLQDRINALKDFDFGKYDTQKEATSILEKFIMHTTDEQGNQISLEYAENLLERLKEFFALAAWWNADRSKHRHSMIYLNKLNVRSFIPAVHPGFQGGRLWKFLALHTQLYKDLWYAVADGLIDIPRYDTYCEIFISTYLMYSGIYRKGLKYKKVYGGHCGTDKYAFYKNSEVWLTQSEIDEAKDMANNYRSQYSQVSMPYEKCISEIKSKFTRKNTIKYIKIDDDETWPDFDQNLVKEYFEQVINIEFPSYLYEEFKSEYVLSEEFTRLIFVEYAKFL